MGSIPRYTHLVHESGNSWEPTAEPHHSPVSTQPSETNQVARHFPVGDMCLYKYMQVSVGFIYPHEHVDNRFIHCVVVYLRHFDLVLHGSFYKIFFSYLFLIPWSSTISSSLANSTVNA